ncbi:MAG: glycosyltransferase [Candidatus Marinimicrobia bacterium]|nr:glycosyltransferase [Candidatus Neomarinimicrobiota bacterium]MCF7828735.1 glycosyltransferase [Candidatus Neomarinimicrobiota bacterium]MCF7880652.1 glycosyltransferase [Candidatus Neomarinimicrobiota bacterium]
MLPKISIITPSFNQSEFLELSIKSVIEQNYPNLEFIVMDGGSSDETLDILNKYDKDIDYWKSERDRGQADAINKGFKLSNGIIIGWLNSDDLLAPNSLFKVAEAYNTNPGEKIFFGDCSVIDHRGNFVSTKITKDFDWHTILLGKSLGQPAVFMNREILKEIGYLEYQLQYALDWAFFLKAFYFYKNNQTKYINSVLGISREYEGTKSRTGLNEKGEERREILKKFFKEFISVDKSTAMKAYAGTYKVQFFDELFAAKLLSSFRSIIYVLYYNPSIILKNIDKIRWIINKAMNRAQEKYE